MTDEEHSPYPKSMIGRGIRSFFHFTGNLFGDGSWKVGPLQQQLIDTLLAALEPKVRDLIKKQLLQRFIYSFGMEANQPILLQRF